MTIIDITSEDEVKTVAALAALIWAEHYTPILGEAQVSYMLKHFQEADAIRRQIKEGYHYSAAFVDGVPAGYSATRYEPKQRRVFLSKLYVAEDFRGQGVARSLLTHHVKALHGAPADTLWLTVNKHNTEALSAYQHMGFVIKESIVTDIGEGYVMDDYVMEKRL